jgi:hypothetical protein
MRSTFCVSPLTVARQRFCKHVPTAADTYATTYVGYCAFCAVRAVSVPCGGGVSTSTVALRVVGGDEKGTQYLEM